MDVYTVSLKKLSALRMSGEAAAPSSLPLTTLTVQ
jgi:hypothetical protein